MLTTYSLKTLDILASWSVFTYLYIMKNAQENTRFLLQEKDNEIALLKSRLQSFEKENAEQSQKIDYLQWELSRMQRLVFSSKSERTVMLANPTQLTLDLGLQDAEAPQAQIQEITYQRRKQSTMPGHARQPLPESLPRQEIVIEPEDLPEGAVKVNEKITEKLCYKPGRLFVLKIVRPYYLIPSLQGATEGQQGGNASETSTSKSFLIATGPYDPFPKFNAHVSLLAYIFVSKFVDHLPFYRLANILKREGCAIAESTINDWFAAICRKLEPLYAELKAQILLQTYLQADESPMPVTDKDKPGSTHLGYMWIYHSPESKQACFDYQKGRAGKYAKAFLATFAGYLQCDGYAGYESLPKNSGGKITLLACMTHARRKFFEARTNDRAFSEQALKLFGELYKIEDRARETKLYPEQIKELRGKDASGHLENLQLWLNGQASRVLPKSPAGKAVHYTIGLWPRLIRYIEDGRFQIDNNLIENLIRPMAIGRKNYMFAGSHQAAQRTAMAYSFMATCKLNDINPVEWLADVLQRIDETKPSRYVDLLPNNWKPLTE